MKATLNPVVTANQIDSVVRLANTIWPEHYTPIIGKEQVEYMLRTFHSPDAISNEITNKGYQYYLIIKEEEPVGYIGVKPEEESLFLSKLYILSRERGSGLGHQTIAFLKELASSSNLKQITLTVNKYNSNSIAAYERFGFQVTGEVCTDIGEGYVMDDYRMALEIQDEPDT